MIKLDKISSSTIIEKDNDNNTFTISVVHDIDNAKYNHGLKPYAIN